MQRRSTTLLTRLALALLVALGFVAPVTTVEADRVVQTVGERPPTVEATSSRALAPAVAAARDTTLASARPIEACAGWLVSQRYLLHRALLL